VRGFLHKGRGGGVSEDNGVGWPRCTEAECTGIRLNAGDKCLAHATPEDLDAALNRIRDQGIDARGVTISAVLLKRVLAAAPSDKQQPDRPCFNWSSAACRHMTLLDLL
jgi:hypothetical protein